MPVNTFEIRTKWTILIMLHLFYIDLAYIVYIYIKRSR